MRSAYSGLSMVCVLAAAGTILGTAAVTAAQARAMGGPDGQRVIVKELRGGGEPKVEVFTDGDGKDGKVEVRVFVDKDGQVRTGHGRQMQELHGKLQEHMGQLHNKMLMLGGPSGQGGHAIARGEHAKGEVCPSCGRPLDEDGAGEGKRETHKKVIRLGEGGAQGWGQAFDGQKWEAFGEGFGKGGAFGKAFMVGPDGQHKEFNFGGGQGGAHAGPGEPKIQIRRMGPGQGGAHAGPKIETHVEGKVIVIGPDGQRREFDLGDGAKSRRGPQGGPGQPQIFEFRDGDEGGQHLWVEPRGGEPDGAGAGPRRIEIRRRPGMNVI